MVQKKDLQLFSCIWCIIFTVVAFYPLLFRSNIRIWSVVIAVIFLFISILKPMILTGFYKLWIKVGEFIGGMISKVIMFFLFFGLFMPISIFLKIIGKDFLNKKIDKSLKSYWIIRKKQPESMKNQF